MLADLYIFREVEECLLRCFHIRPALRRKKGCNANLSYSTYSLLASLGTSKEATALLQRCIVVLLGSTMPVPGYGTAFV